MRLHFEGERILAVVAHPDDAELFCAGTMSRARDDGAAIGVCYLCLGDKGQPSIPVDDLAAARRREAMSAAQVLGAELFTGIFSDMMLADSEEVRLHLTTVYRMFQPTLIFTHAPNDYHTDHRTTAQVAEVATWLSASKGLVTEGLDPVPSQPALWWMDTLGMTGFEPTVFMDVTEKVELKEKMLNCHKTQLARGAEGTIHPLEELMLEQLQCRGRESGVSAAEAFRPYATHKRTRAW